MVSQCKICGTTTAGHRQYCPDCRRHYKGRGYGGPIDGGINTVLKQPVIYGVIVNALGPGFIIFGYYLLTMGVSAGFWSILLGVLIIGAQVHSPKARNRFKNNYDGPKYREEGCEILSNKTDKIGVIFFLIYVAVMLLVGYFIFSVPHNQTNSSNLDENVSIALSIENSNSNQKIISPEEKLITSCMSKYLSAGVFDLKTTGYLEDFSSASNWIGNNYENSALTPEQKDINLNYIINNQLPKQGYPLVITWASKRIDAQTTATGFYYCNENGVLN